MDDTNLAKGRRYSIVYTEPVEKGGIGKKSKRVKRSTRRTNAPRYATRTSNSGKRVSFSFPAPRILPSLSRARVSTFLGCVLFAEARQSCVSGRRRNETEQRVFVKCLNKMFVVSCGRRQGQIKCDALTQPDCQYSECVCNSADRYSQRTERTKRRGVDVTVDINATYIIVDETWRQILCAIRVWQS